MRWAALLAVLAAVAAVGCDSIYHVDEHDAAARDAAPADGPHPIDAPRDAVGPDAPSGDAPVVDGPHADAEPIDAPPPIDAAGPCGGGYTAIAGGTPGATYRIQTTSQLVWATAENHCEQNTQNGMYSHLVVATSVSELDAVARFANDQNVAPLWIGLRDTSPGVFAWVTAQNGSGAPLAFPPATGTQWVGGHPTEPDGNPNCIEAFANGTIQYATCGTTVAYLCQCDTFQPTN